MASTSTEPPVLGDTPVLGPEDFPQGVELAFKEATKTSYQLVNTFNVDSRYFYQGLEFVEGSDFKYLYISEGHYGG